MKAAIATMMLAVAALAATPAAGHVIRGDDAAIVREARDQSRIDEVFPVKHRCSEVSVFIHAQDLTQHELKRACNVFRQTEDTFHSFLGTSVENRITYSYHPELLQSRAVDVYVYSIRNRAVPEEVFGLREGAGAYIPGSSEHVGYIVSPDVRHVLSHEYAHHLDRVYLSLPPSLQEGLAEYVAFRTHWLTLWENREGYVPSIPQVICLIRTDTHCYDQIGAEVEEVFEDISFGTLAYGWGSLVIHFLVEQHSDSWMNLKRLSAAAAEMGRPSRSAAASIAHLTDEFREWIRNAYLRLTPRELDGPIYVIAGNDDINRDLMAVEIAFYYLFGVPTGALDYSLNFSGGLGCKADGAARLLCPGLDVNTAWVTRPWTKDTDPLTYDSLYLRGVAPSSHEITITAQTPDGQSATVSFTVIVVEPLEYKEITIRDTLSLDEGQTAVNLRNYYTGSEDIDFTATSSNEKVATVEVTADGRLIVNAVSSGEVEVTVTATSPGQGASQTFTIIVVKERPLESKEITIRDTLSLEEGRTTINLRSHYTGPVNIEFTATSSNEEVATVEVFADGRLIVNAVSSGEVQITIRAKSLGDQYAEQTFTIVVSNETPPWLERGFFSGWRKVLLED